MGWLRMESGCGVSHDGEVGWALTVVSGVMPSSTGRGVAHTVWVKAFVVMVFPLYTAVMVPNYYAAQVMAY